jgi:redox-sensitive bicupin YhaK (pirin superfamily)
MSRPTFGAHPHAGMSALSILFEDSEGVFNNRDSLGNNIDLLPGDAFWLKAGSGAVHDEKPTEGSRTHGLQIFVNLPQRHKHDAPASRHLPSAAMPVITGEGYRVRVVLGGSNGTQGLQSPALPLTALDAFLDAGGTYAHDVYAQQSLLIYAVSGTLTVRLDDQEIHLSEEQAIAMQPGAGAQSLKLSSEKGAHLVVLQGSPIQEQFVQKGPFVMSTMTDIQKVTAAYEAGQLGSIAE